CLASIVAVRSGGLNPAQSHREWVKKKKNATVVSVFRLPTFRPIQTLFHIYNNFKLCYLTKQQ
ncbi:hypothetical protein, partial [Enterobacter asburiae]